MLLLHCFLQSFSTQWKKKIQNDTKHFLSLFQVFATFLLLFFTLLLFPRCLFSHFLHANKTLDSILSSITFSSTRSSLVPFDVKCCCLC